MTEVLYEEFRMEIRGHAGSAAYGHDLVCAGVSTLCCALVNAAVRYGAEMYISDDETVVRVEVRPTPENEKECREMFRVILLGFRALEDQWPEYVSTDIYGEGD